MQITKNGISNRVKKQPIIFLAMMVFTLAVFTPAYQTQAEELASRLKGRILLQVESKGEAWYVNPKDGKRYYMANGFAAYNIMRNLGVGITNKDLAKIKADKVFAKKQQGKIFLQVESHGEAYYIDINGLAHYLKDGPAAYGIMRQLGLGIKTSDLVKINLSDKDNATSTVPVVEVVNYDVKISSSTCDWTIISDQYGNKSDCLRAIVKGTAEGPVGTRIELPILVWSTDKWDCGDWTLTTGALITVGSTCTRKEGQPKTTTWTVDTEGDECPTKNYFNSNRSYSSKIYKKGSIYSEKEDKVSYICQ